jgi:hypothetical protein
MQLWAEMIVANTHTSMEEMLNYVESTCKDMVNLMGALTLMKKL